MRVVVETGAVWQPVCLSLLLTHVLGYRMDFRIYVIQHKAPDWPQESSGVAEGPSIG